MKIWEAIALAEQQPDRCVPIGTHTLLGEPAATVPQIIEVCSNLPEPERARSDMPVGWGIFSPLRSPVVVTLATRRRSSDSQRQPIDKGAEGWIVCMWRVGDPATVRIRLGFNPIPPSTEHRWTDVDHSELATIPALAGKPMDFVNWELRRLEGAFGY